MSEILNDPELRAIIEQACASGSLIAAVSSVAASANLCGALNLRRHGNNDRSEDRLDLGGDGEQHIHVNWSQVQSLDISLFHGEGCLSLRSKSASILRLYRPEGPFPEALAAAVQSWQEARNKPKTQDPRAFSGSPYEKRFGFCRALKRGSKIFVAGIAPIEADGSCADSAADQAQRCFDIILVALAELGAGAEQIVRTRMYLTDAQDAEAVGAVHERIFAKNPPAATMIVVASLLNPAWRVEIEVDCERISAESS